MAKRATIKPKSKSAVQGANKPADHKPLGVSRGGMVLDQQTAGTTILPGKTECPRCLGTKTRVQNSILLEGKYRVRYCECKKCGTRFKSVTCEDSS